MFGIVEWTEKSHGRKGAWLGEEVIGGVRFVKLTLFREEKYRPLSLRRRCAAGAKLLRRAGMTRAVFPKDFPYGEQFEKQGIRPVPELPLRRELAAAFAAFVMNRRGLSPASVNVAVVAERLGGEVMRAVTELCRHNRYVLLSVPGGCADFCRELRRSYGVSVLQEPTEEQLQRADVLLQFAPMTLEKGPGQSVIPLYEGTENAFGWSAVLSGLTVPEDCQQGQLLAALREAGALRPDCLEVTSFQVYA